jgi:hypothetical protein
MRDFLPLVNGDGPLEAFSLNPGTYPRDCGYLGHGVGLRRPVGMSPLEPGTVFSIYGDLHEIKEFIEKDLQAWQVFSTIGLANPRPGPTYMMLGPIQLVSSN